MSSKAAGKKGIVEGSGPLPPQQPVKIFGNFMYAEMRTICNLMDIAKRAYRVESAGDTFTEAGAKDEASFNPSQAMPLVVVNETKILADPATLAKHICRHFQVEQLYPLAANMDSERQKIDQILEVVFLHFKLCGDRLLKLTVRAKAAAAGKLNLTSEQLASQEAAIAYEKTVVETAVMRTINTWLEETEVSYLVTDRVSAADIAAFHTLKQAMVFGEM